MSEYPLFDSLDDDSIRSAFERFHTAHPEVYALFERFALEAIRRGRGRLGAKAVWERMRWETSVGGEEDFRLNNNFTAYYARRFMERHPEHDGVFELRRVKEPA